MNKVLYAYLKLMSLSSYVGRDILKLHENVGLASIANFNENDWRSLNASPNFINAWKKLDDDWVDRQMLWLEAHPDIQIIKFGDDAYPALLSEIKNPPFYLFVMGDSSVLNKNQLAIVGSRKASHQGLSTAERFAFECARSQLVITSGMALGVDGAAHLGVLKAQGKTIAVLGTGLGRLYPKKHIRLAEKIVANGAVISEFPPLMAAHPQNFPIRNRIISGLSLGTLVVEATQRSGSLITANIAADQGREVFAVPGSIANPNMQGANALLQQGAHLVQNSKDILDILKLLPVSQQETARPVFRHALFQYFDDAPTSLDVIVARSGLPASTVAAQLLELELEKHIAREPGGFEILYR